MFNVQALASPTNIRQGWKSLPGTNTLLQKSVNYGQKKFYNIGPRRKIDTDEKEKKEPMVRPRKALTPMASPAKVGFLVSFLVSLTLFLKHNKVKS
jgi:hypothetical protein